MKHPDLDPEGFLRMAKYMLEHGEYSARAHVAVSSIKHALRALQGAENEVVGSWNTLHDSYKDYQYDPIPDRPGGKSEGYPL